MFPKLGIPEVSCRPESFDWKPKKNPPEMVNSGKSPEMWSHFLTNLCSRPSPDHHFFCKTGGGRGIFLDFTKYPGLTWDFEDDVLVFQDGKSPTFGGNWFGTFFQPPNSRI